MTVLFDMTTFSGTWSQSLRGALVPTYNLPPAPIVVTVPSGFGTGNVILEPEGVTIPNHGFGTTTTIKMSFPTGGSDPIETGAAVGFRIPTDLPWGDELILSNLNPTGPPGPPYSANANITASHSDHLSPINFAGSGYSTPAPESSPIWLRLICADTSGIYAVEIWQTDPALGGVPVYGPNTDTAAQGDSGFTADFTGDAVPHLELGGFTGTLTLEEWIIEDHIVVGGASEIAVSADPRSIVADGNAQSDLTATVIDAEGNPVGGDAVVFTADSATAGAAGTCGPTTDNGDGSYSAKYTSTTTAGDVTITATDSTPGPAISATCVVHQTPTAVGNMAFGPPKHGIVRQGRS